MPDKNSYKMPNQILIASGNNNKIVEMNNLLKEQPIELFSLNDFKIDSPEETGLTFIENALIKARHAAKHSKMATLADDSGLIVDALNGEPGIYSARYSSNIHNINQNQANINKLLDNLKKLNTPNKAFTAKFICVLVFLKHYNDPCPIVIQNFWHGQIILENKGINGFGYDPIFYIPTLKKTAAELTKEEKQNFSHRGQALREFIELIK
tara:strand:- start:2482 stop:3111 length:630 start_codon:yes stop_codon:yes gene_type:complete